LIREGDTNGIWHLIDSSLLFDIYFMPLESRIAHNTDGSQDFKCFWTDTLVFCVLGVHPTLEPVA
jgi:hypothetical protein